MPSPEDYVEYDINGKSDYELKERMRYNKLLMEDNRTEQWVRDKAEEENHEIEAELGYRAYYEDIWASVMSYHYSLYAQYKEEWVRDNVPDEIRKKAGNEIEKVKDKSYEKKIDDFVLCEYQDVDWLASHLKAEDAAFLSQYDEDFPTDKTKGVKWKDGKLIERDTGSAERKYRVVEPKGKTSVDIDKD